MSVAEPNSPIETRSLKLIEFLPEVPKAVVSFIEENFGPMNEEHVEELNREFDVSYIRIPEKAVLDLLTTKEDAGGLVKEAFDLIDSGGGGLFQILINVRPGNLSKKKLKAFGDPALKILAQRIIYTILGANQEIPSIRSPLLLEVRAIHALLQKKKVKKETSIREEEIEAIAEALTASIIDVEGLLQKLENKINPGQYL